MESITYPNGTYFGGIADGKREGKGTFIYNNGSRYTGGWLNDMMHGSGYLFDEGGNELHHAVWYEGKIIYEIGDSWDSPQSEISSDRVALLIGNCDYYGSGKLNNCISDAEILSGKLRSLGFDTTLVKDARKTDVTTAIRNFTQKARNKEVALFFYSGHGVCCNGKTYIVPIDSRDYSTVDTAYYCIDDIVNRLDEAGCNIKIAVIDACRVNPGKGLSKGLYSTNAKNVLVAYATSPNYTASDGMAGTHSPYIRAIMQILDKPRIPLVSFFQEVSGLVYDFTNGQQQPFIESSLTNIDFFFNRG